MNREISSTWDGKDYFLYKQHIAMQSPVAIEVFNNFFEVEKFDLIIEIGTAGGGWSIFLKEHAAAMSADFITYDIINRPVKDHQFYELNIDYRLKDVFQHSEEIIDLIKQNKRVALFCDGGDKIKEFKIFSQHLKSKDFIFAHDYAPSYERFVFETREKWWGWCEISDEYIESELTQYSLTKYEEETFIKSAWLAAYKL